MPILIPSLNDTLRCDAGNRASTVALLDYAHSISSLKGAVIYHRFDLRKELMLPLLADRFDLVIMLHGRGIVMVCTSQQDSRAYKLKTELANHYPEWGERTCVLFDRKIDADIWLEIENIFAPLLVSEDKSLQQTSDVRRFLDEAMGVEALPPCYPDEHDQWLDHRFELILRRKGEVEKVILDDYERSRQDGKPMRLHINGAAGSGKTISAMRIYRMLLRENKKPLLVCYNHRLGRWLNQQLQHTSGYADTLFRLARETLSLHKLAAVRPDAHHMNALMDALNSGKLIINEDERYDAVIVDEGQDFHQAWADVLIKHFLKRDGDLVWLEDQNQNILTRNQPVHVGDVIAHDSELNFRTPLHISEYTTKVLGKVSALLGTSTPPPVVQGNNEIPGWPVMVHYHSSEAEAENLLSNRINALISEGVSRHEILVLVNSDDAHGLLMDHAIVLGRRSYTLKKLPEFDLCRYIGEYAYDGSKIHKSDSGIYCESIVKIKGLEEYVVLLTDINPPAPNTPDADIYVKKLYCSLTRAKARLEVFVAKDNPLVKCFTEI